MNNEIIKTTKLCKSYGKTQALRDISISIAEGSITGLVGRNGSGKTTLLKILSGLLDKTSGEVLVFGHEPMDTLGVLSKLVYTYHNVVYNESLTLASIIKNYKTMFANFDKEFAEKLALYFDLSPKRKYRDLSQGMRSVFNYLCALACRTELTLYDEPVLGMDVAARKSAYEVLLRDFAEHPRTIVISSHLLSEIEGVLSDILLIEKGEVVLHGDIGSVREMAYRVDGNTQKLDGFTKGKNVIARKTSELNDFAIIREKLTEASAKEAKSQELTIFPVSAEDLCVYLTRQDKEEELKCLW